MPGLAVSRRWLPAVFLIPAFGLATLAAAPAGRSAENKDDKPSITIKASPLVGFAPMRVVLTAELKGGSDDYKDFYCATVEWDWGNGTRSESTADCEPYEQGKSEIKRRYVKDYIFRVPDEYRVQFRLKQKDKVVGYGRTTIRVRPGLGFGDGH